MFYLHAMRIRCATKLNHVKLMTPPLLEQFSWRRWVPSALTLTIVKGWQANYVTDYAFVSLIQHPTARALIRFPAWSKIPIVDFAWRCGNFPVKLVIKVQFLLIECNCTFTHSCKFEFHFPSSSIDKCFSISYLLLDVRQGMSDMIRATRAHEGSCQSDIPIKGCTLGLSSDRRFNGRKVDNEQCETAPRSRPKPQSRRWSLIHIMLGPLLFCRGNLICGHAHGQTNNMIRWKFWRLSAVMISPVRGSFLLWMEASSVGCQLKRDLSQDLDREGQWTPLNISTNWKKHLVSPY